MTRVAGANPRIWVDIFLDNADALREALAEHRRRVEQLEAALAAGDAGFLARWIGEAARNRRRMLEQAFAEPASSSGCASTCPTGPACSRGSRRRSAPSESTSRTSSCSTSRPSGAASRRSVSGEGEARARATLLEAQGYGVVARRGRR